MSEERWREALAQHHEELRGEEHPAAETLWALAAGDLAAPEARRVVDHVSRCPACAEDLRATRGLVAEARAHGALDPSARPEGRTAQAGGRSVTSSAWGRGLAAAAVLFVAVAGWLRLGVPDGMETDPTYRQGPGDDGIVSLLDAAAPLPREEAVLRWSEPPAAAGAGPGGVRYDVTVTTAELRPVAVARGVEEPRFRLRPESLEDLPVGTELLWQVEAHLPDGSRLASGTFSVLLGDRDVSARERP